MIPQKFVFVFPLYLISHFGASRHSILTRGKESNDRVARLN